MKLHELDWNEVLGTLPRWDGLSPAARRAFIGIKPGQGFALAPLGAAGDELKAAGLLVAPTGRGTQHGLDPVLRPLLVALRAADRLCPVEGPGGKLRQEYVVDQLNVMQSLHLAASGRTYYNGGDRKRAADTASSAAWVRGYLAAAESTRTLARWEEDRRPPGEKPRLAFPAVAQALRALVQALAPHPRGVPLRSVAERVPDAAPDAVAAALAAGLRYLLVFVSVTRDADAVVGLLPAVAARLSGTVAPPVPVEAREIFAAPFRAGDLTALLVEAATEPIAIRAADESLYVRAQRAIAARLAAVPPWVARFAVAGLPEEEEDDDDGYEYEEDGADDEDGGIGAAAAARVEAAVHFAVMLRMATAKRTGNRARLEATRTGRAWLAGGEGERLKAVLTALRNLPQRNPSAYGGTGELDFFGAPLGFQVEIQPVDARTALSAAFLSTPPGAQVPFAEFARYHAQENNPYVGPGGTLARARGYWGTEPTTAEGWEDAWASVLLSFLARRLVPLGCATLGRTQDGHVAFGLTDAGRYLLGERDGFELAPETGGGEVVVQPDFEIVFLAPAPRAEAELGRIAERTGAGVGALFRLTRASVLRAAEQGMTADGVLSTLQSVSRVDVPANVARQVRDWMKAVRTVRIAPAVLIECPDAETAGRVLALGGAQVAAVAPTVLRLEGDAKAQSAFVKRLRERGIFVGSGDAPRAVKATPRGRPPRSVG